MQIIPAIDIFEARCVRLVEGDFRARTLYPGSPAAVAARFAGSGARALHVVDLEGAKEGRLVNTLSMAEICRLTGLEVQAGGGVRTRADVEFLLGAGARRVVVGSIALRLPGLFASWAEEFGGGKFCVALDLKDGRLAYGGWQQTDPEADFPRVVERLERLGVRRVLTTDVRRDGKLEGPNIPLYRELVRAYPGIDWIASGGVRSIQDVEELRAAGAAGVVIGKALHDGHLRLEELLPAC